MCVGAGSACGCADADWWRARTHATCLCTRMHMRAPPHARAQEREALHQAWQQKLAAAQAASDERVSGLEAAQAAREAAQQAREEQQEEKVGGGRARVGAGGGRGNRKATVPAAGVCTLCALHAPTRPIRLPAHPPRLTRCPVHCRRWRPSMRA